MALAWDDVATFLATWRSGSFTAAAATLGVRQSTVSRRIARLEERLGPLFDRGPRGLRPTALAQRLAGEAEAMEAAAQRLVDAADGHERAVEGTVRIATTESLANHLIIPALPALRAAHPALRFELLVGLRSVDLATREADIALRFVRPTAGDLVFKRVSETPTAILGAPRWAGVPWEDLERVAVDLPGLPSPEEAWWASVRARPPVLITNNYPAMVSGVRAGLGVAMLSRSLLRVYPELITIAPPLPTPSLSLWLVAHRSARQIPRVQVAWAMLEGIAAQLTLTLPEA